MQCMHSTGKKLKRNTAKKVSTIFGRRDVCIFEQKDILGQRLDCTAYDTVWTEEQIEMELST